MSELRQVAIVGLNKESAALLPNLLEAEGIQVIKILNPELEDINRLTQYPHLSVIIDTTHNESVSVRLRKLPLKKVDVITGLSARILFCSVRNNNIGEHDGILRSLQELRETVCLTKNKDEILKVILTTAVRISQADCGSIMLLDPSKRHLTIEAAYGINENVVVSSIQKAGKGISGVAVRGGKPILIQGIADPSTYGSDYQKPEIVSSICCPLMYDNEAIGVINISSKKETRVFSHVDEQFLVELSQLTTEVIKTSRDNACNLHSTYVLGLLNSVREILSMKYRFEERLNLLLMKMANAFAAKECTYYEYNPADRTFTAKSSSSIGLSLLKERPMLLDDFFAQRVLNTSNTICVNATAKIHRTKKWYLLHPIRLGAQHELVGTLFIYLNSEKNHLKEESSLLKKIGDMLAREMTKNREMETIKVQSLKYSAISQFSFDIANAKTLPELTKMILSNVRLIMDSESCILRLRNKDTRKLEVMDTVSYKHPNVLKELLCVDELITADISPGKGVVRINDLSQSDYGNENLSTESILALGIEINGEVAGTLSLYEKKSMDQTLTHGFTEQDREILLNFGLQISKGLKRFFPFSSTSEPGMTANVPAESLPYTKEPVL